MDLPHLDTCCCGCSLKTGTVTIGSIDSVISAIGMIVTIYVSIIEGIYQSYPIFNEDGSIIWVDDNKHLIIFVFFSLFNASRMIISIFLTVGASKEQSAFLLPWIVHVIIYMCFYIGFTIYILIRFPYTIEIIVFIVIALFFICIQSYVYLVVYSFYRNIKRAETTTQNYNY